MTFLHKLIIGNRFLRYSGFWWWWRLISHSGFRFDDYHVWKEFWYSINKGFLDMNYRWEFEKFWGKNAKPETILLSPEDYDALVERINEPPDPEALESIRKLLDRKTPWNT